MPSTEPHSSELLSPLQRRIVLTRHQSRVTGFDGSNPNHTEAQPRSRHAIISLQVGPVRFGPATGEDIDDSTRVQDGEIR